jgi:hypothetical protein
MIRRNKGATELDAPCGCCLTSAQVAVRMLLKFDVPVP